MPFLRATITPPSTNVSDEARSSPRILCNQNGSLSRMFHIVNMESSEMVTSTDRGTSKSNARMG